MDLKEENDANFIIHFNKGLASLSLDDYDTAIKHFDASLSLNQNHAETHLCKGIALESLCKYMESIECYENVIRCSLDPLTNNEHIISQAYNNKAVALGNMNKFDEALECLNELIKLNPTYEKGYFNKGFILLKSKNDKQSAFQIFDEVIRLKPTSSEAFKQKGIAHEFCNEYMQAVECYNEALKRMSSSNDVHLYMLKGEAAQYLEDYEEACRSYQMALKLNPNLIEAHFNMGIIFKHLNKVKTNFFCK